MATAYQEATQALARLPALGAIPGLERMRALLAALGNPQTGMRGVLVAGSNGKGSVCASLDAMARSAGLTSALLVKPHLVEWTERIVINGTAITQPEFARLFASVETVIPRLEASLGPPLRMEMLTAMGLLAARQANVDLLICEVGMGGRLDSTNVLDLGVAVITTVSLEHRAVLGDTVAKIAAEKAAIIKPGNTVLTGCVGEALEVVRARSAAEGSRLSVLGTELGVAGAGQGRDGVEVTLNDGLNPSLTVRSSLCGAIQIPNVALAAAAARALRPLGIEISDEAIVLGAAATPWPGRLQWIEGEPAYLLDGAHNPAAMAGLVADVPILVQRRPLTIIFGAMSDKEIQPMLASLRELTETPIFAASGSERAYSPAALAALWGPMAKWRPSLPAAMEIAERQTGKGGVVLVTGSLALVGEVLAARIGSTSRERRQD